MHGLPNANVTGCKMRMSVHAECYVLLQVCLYQGWKPQAMFVVSCHLVRVLLAVSQRDALLQYTPEVRAAKQSFVCCSAAVDRREQCMSPLCQPLARHEALFSYISATIFVAAHSMAAATSFLVCLC